VRAGILNRSEGGDFRGLALKDLPSGVCGARRPLQRFRVELYAVKARGADAR